jgi:subtilisin family serine protease
MTSDTPAAGRQADDRQPRNRAIIQQQYAIGLLPPTARYGPDTWRQDGVSFIYDSRALVVHDDYVDPLAAELRRLDQGPRRDLGDDFARPLAGSFRLVRTDLAGGGADALDTLHRVRGRRRSGFDDFPPGRVSVHHYLSITGNGGRCAPVEPQVAAPTTAPIPPTGNPEAGRGVRVVVLDTGYDPGAATANPWLAGVSGQPDELLHDGEIDRYGGHGTFIAGVLRCVAPAAEVTVLNPFTGDGEVTEESLVTALQSAVDTGAVDIISISAGTGGYDEHGPLALNAWGEALRGTHPEIAVIAAAGNDATDDRFYPAAGNWAFGVGAFDTATGARAAFSNFGDWVQVYAPGVDLVNAFPAGVYTYGEQNPGTRATFTGRAVWSGTSFSTPVVAGLVAAHMSETGRNARAATADLIASAASYPAVGRVLLP